MDQEFKEFVDKEVEKFFKEGNPQIAETAIEMTKLVCDASKDVVQLLGISRVKISKEFAVDRVLIPLTIALIMICTDNFDEMYTTIEKIKKGIQEAENSFNRGQI